jgi:hypothetical protein
VVNEHETGGSSEEESSGPVSPSESGDGHREQEAHGDDEGEVELVLPLDDLVLGQVTHVGDSGSATGLQDHPSCEKGSVSGQRGRECRDSPMCDQRRPR